MADHIQINDVTPRIAYAGDGTQTAFTYPFPIFKAADLAVYLDSTQQTTGYTVTGAGDSAGGTVTFDAAPAAGVLVTLRRALALARTSDFQADGIIRAKTLNDELDYQVAAVQQVAETAGRAVQRAITSTSTADLTLPEPTARRAILWNAAADGLTTSTFDPDAMVTQAQAAVTAAQDALTGAVSAEAAAETARDAAQTAAAAAAAGVASALADYVAQAQDAEAAAQTAEDGAAAAKLAAQAAQTAAEAAAASVGDPLSKTANLSDLTDVAAARDNLGLTVGTTVQAHGANLDALSDLAGGTNQMPYFNAAGTLAAAPLTPFARTLLDDTDATAVKTTLGIGGGALEYVSTVTLSGVTSVDLTGLASGYDYIFVSDALVNSSGVDVLAFRLGLADGTFPSAAAYYNTMVGGTSYASATGPNWGEAAGAQAFGNFGITAPSSAYSMVMELLNVGSASWKKWMGNGTWLNANSGYYYGQSRAGVWQNASAVTAIRFYSLYGYATTGTIVVYRRKRSA